MDIKKILEESEAKVRKFSNTTLSGLIFVMIDILSELCDSDMQIKKIYNAYLHFQEDVNQWADLTKGMYYNSIPEAFGFGWLDFEKNLQRWRQKTQA